MLTNNININHATNPSYRYEPQQTSDKDTHKEFLAMLNTAKNRTPEEIASLEGEDARLQEILSKIEIIGLSVDMEAAGLGDLEEKMREEARRNGTEKMFEFDRGRRAFFMAIDEAKKYASYDDPNFFNVVSEVSRGNAPKSRNEVLSALKEHYSHPPLADNYAQQQKINSFYESMLKVVEQEG